MPGTKCLRDPVARGLTIVVVLSKDWRRRFSPAVLKFWLYSYGAVFRPPDVRILNVSGIGKGQIQP
jgi:hypothetical protein